MITFRHGRQPSSFIRDTRVGGKGGGRYRSLGVPILYDLDPTEHFVKAPLYSMWEILRGPVKPLAHTGPEFEKMFKNLHNPLIKILDFSVKKSRKSGVWRSFH